MNKDLTVSVMHIEDLFLSRAIRFFYSVYIFVPLIMYVVFSSTLVTNVDH